MSDHPVTIYHNPRCSKSRQTLALLEQRNITPEIILYLETPLTSVQLQSLLGMLGIAARDLIRTSEVSYKEQNLADESLSDAALLQAMVTTPKLMQRPIVIAGGQARIGRPPEAVLEIV